MSKERTRLLRKKTEQPSVESAASQGLTGSERPLDAGTRAAMEPRFGHDFSHVRIHTEARAAESAAALHARAYTVGEDITFGSGEYAPGTSHGRRLLAHELTHVVQQSGGSIPAGIPAAPRAVQRAVKTLGGSWDTDSYSTVTNGTKDEGVDIDLKFVPEAPVDAKKIGMTQTANSIKAGKPIAINDTVKDRSIGGKEAGLEAGAHIDQLAKFRNPLYATGATGAGDTLGTTPTSAQWGQHGWHYTDSGGAAQHQDAHLKDTPQLPGRGADAGQIFETTALAVEGPQEGTYYGSVRWGWRTDGTGVFTRLPLSIVSAGNPSASFQRSAELWNKTKASDGADTLDLPVNQNESLTVDPTTIATGEVAVRIARLDAEIAKASGTGKTQLEFEKKALEIELAKRPDQPTTSYAAQESAAAAKSSEDIIKRLKELAAEIPGLPADATKTDRIIEKSALEAELPKRMIKVSVTVHETEDVLGSDNVVVTVAGFGKGYRSGEKKLNNGESGDFLIPLSAVMWGAMATLPFAVNIYDADWPDGDDLMFEKSWTPPFSPVSDTQSRDGGRYEAKIQFEK